jgi:putative ABC transport system permease protein
MLNTILNETRLAIRNLSRNRSRTIVGVLTVASGVVAYLLAGGFIAWIFQDMREATIHSQLGHAQIIRPAFFERGIANPYGFLLPVDSAEQEAVAAMPGVVAVTPRLVFGGLISLADTTVAFAGEGVDPIRERPISSRITILDGKDLESLAERRILLGEGLAKTLGAKPNDTVVLLGTAANGGTSAVELTVAGIFASVAKEYDDTAVRVPINVARKLMRVTGATSWVVLLDGADRTDEFVAAARSRLAPTAFEVVPWTVLADFYNKTVVLLSRQVDVVKIIIGLIIVLTISNTLTMSVLERTTEIGTSLAIGLPGGAVMRLFVIEGVLLGILGGLVGLVIGYLLALAISAIGIPMPPPPGMAHGYVGQIILTGGLATDAIFLSVVTTLLASALPAWKAGRMNIVDALRYSQ